ncbi:Hypoxanthine-guanine phosphoribosyltransferase [uncultured Desulfobacterium sp.]|uniref:Hypoxanthine phosphoribosyltransferase n=1 Tax=uncultured Desulfobacterium sp. TaxID=201089 RepID=A0A445N319_9BACT|nr:Hypoxanthine-guanine phosphoribosyltransferase [uncultured Desulfobacterium sp.]
MEKEILISRERIRERVKDLARQISSDYEGKSPLLIGILKGSVFFFADLVREISIPVDIDFIGASSYGSQMESSGKIRLTKQVDSLLCARPVILVEDIVDTGLTLTHLVKTIESNSPESIKICALIDKLERRERTVCVDYCGFQIEKGFIVGYGLDYNEKYRQLPDIYIIK